MCQQNISDQLAAGKSNHLQTLFWSTPLVFKNPLLVCSCDGELARGNGGIFFPQGGVLKCFQIFWLPLCVTKLLVPNLKRNSLLILSTTVCLIHVYVLSMSSMTFWTEHKLFSLQIFKKWLGHLLWEEDLIICGI